MVGENTIATGQGIMIPLLKVVELQSHCHWPGNFGQDNNTGLMTLPGDGNTSPLCLIWRVWDYTSQNYGVTIDYNRSAVEE